MHELLKTARIGEYHGCVRRDFWFQGHPATVVFPKRAAPGHPWLWRAEFFGDFDAVDAALLKKGYTITYDSLSNLYGCPEAVMMMKQFYDFCVKEIGLSEKTVLLGLSRGGLYAVNYALAYPETVRALYLDAPVLDLKSWPCHTDRRQPMCREIAECYQVYGLDSRSILTFDRNPIDRAGELIDRHIPIVVVAGDADDVVPHLQNCQRLIDLYEERGGRYLYLLKEGCGHHPHSLEDPTPVVDFICSCHA